MIKVKTLTRKIMAFNNNKGELEFPHEIVDVDSDTNSELLKDFTGV